MEHILGHFVAIVAISCTFGIPAATIMVLARFRHRQRMELIRKGIYPVTAMPVYPGNKSLFLGFLFTGIGLAHIVAMLVTGEYHDMAGGIILLGAGIAFLAYWKLTAPDRERDRGIYEERIGAVIKTNWMTGAAPRVHEETEKTAIE